MAIVNAFKLARSFGADDIFDNITVSIPHGSRIALVGPNGAGKTTLLRLLAKLDEPDGGTLSHSKGLRVGVLPQEAELVLNGDDTVWDEMLTVFADLINLEDRLDEVAEAVSDNPSDADLLEEYGKLQVQFEIDGGYDYLIRTRQVLSGLGFDEDDYDRPISQLSGGQKTRALLARLLLEAPDLLILDEPTNHLDISAIEWLEGWVKGFEGALLVVSHDRYFMDKVVNHVWELIFGMLEEYRGNFSHYVHQREERHSHLIKEYERQREFIEKEQDYIRRNIAGQNTRQAQGRRKRLERFMRDKAIFRPREQHDMSLKIQTSRRSGDKVLMTEDLVIGYHDDGIPLFSVPDITLYRGERAALIGANGTGKSTFIKTLLGDLAPLQGEHRIGANVEVAYFAQAHEGLNHDNNILDEILSVKNLGIAEARNYLGRFLFRQDDVFKPISALSGGERGRVALAKLALGGANLLLLDEPTNHLDIASQEILETVLSAFEGTILLISHDRYLIQNIASQIWALNLPEKGSEETQSQMVIFEESYKEYLSWREGRAPKAKKAQGKKKESAPKPKTKKPLLSSYERRKQLDKVEKDIHRLEVEMVNLQGALAAASTNGDVDEVARLGKVYTETETQLEDLMHEWEGLNIED